MTRVFTERYYRIDLNTLPTKNENFLPNKGYLPFPLQLIISQKSQQQQYITNAIACQFLSILQVTFFARNLNKIAHFQEVVFLFGFFSEFFSGGFFHGKRKSTKKMFFFATTVKPNSQNNCIKGFPFCRHKEKQVSLLAASRKIPCLVFRKIPLNVKHFFASRV